MRHQKIQTADDMLRVAETNGGFLLFKDTFGKFWEIKQLKYVNDDLLTETQVCLHDWRNEDFNEGLNCFMQRCCRKCQLCQRWQTGTGEWKNVWNDGERARRKEDKK